MESDNQDKNCGYLFEYSSLFQVYKILFPNSCRFSTVSNIYIFLMSGCSSALVVF